MVFSDGASWGFAFSLLFSTESQYLTFIWYPEEPQARRNYKPNFSLGSMSSAHTKVNGRWAQTSKGKNLPFQTKRNRFTHRWSAAACEAKHGKWLKVQALEVLISISSWRQRDLRIVNTPAGCWAGFQLSWGTVSSIHNFLGFYGLKIKGLLKLTFFVSILNRLGLFNLKHFISGLFKAKICRLGSLNGALGRWCRNHHGRKLCLFCLQLWWQSYLHMQELYINLFFLL